LFAELIGASTTPIFCAIKHGFLGSTDGLCSAVDFFLTSISCNQN
jgi:hypothetical protein